jgi:argininosuccinate lyase
MTKKLWKGRFAEKTAHIVDHFTASIDVDKRLYAYDIAGSVAHCKMLAKTGIITGEDAEAILGGLEQIKEEIEAGKFNFDVLLEDIHMHIEARLIEMIGSTAQKLHTARSRNDQVALDVRMFLRDETLRIIQLLGELQKAIVLFAKSHVDVVLPGYTHLQRAQPVLFAHHLMAYYEMFARDIQRMEDCLERINVMPLGAAALAGTTHPIDREFTAKLLDFPKISANSIDAVSDRDFVLEFLSAVSICMVHFSRLSEEFILWATAEFAFIELPDSFATGSSIMPQKKNPDVSELVRAKSGRIFGALMAQLTIMKGLPLAYNKDLQEDKRLLFDAVDTLVACIDIYCHMFPELKINEEVMSQAATSGFLNATDMADYLVGKGMPFREAHHCVGKAVSYALKHHKELHELTLVELQVFAASIQGDIFDYLNTRQIIDRRTSIGGTATQLVKKAIARAEKHLDSQRRKPSVK